MKKFPAELENYLPKGKKWLEGEGLVLGSTETQGTLELSAGEKSGDKMRWRVWATDAQGKDGGKSQWNGWSGE